MRDEGGEPVGSRRRRLLFLCGRNQWRSPTAARIFSRSSAFEVRAAGVSASAVRKVTASDVEWADVIFVMESDHKRQLVRAFRDAIEDRPVHVLDIPDEYRFMDPELVDLLRAGVSALLGEAEDAD